MSINPSGLRCCWLGKRKGILPVKKILLLPLVSRANQCLPGKWLLKHCVISSFWYSLLLRDSLDFRDNMPVKVRVTYCWGAECCCIPGICMYVSAMFCKLPMNLCIVVCYFCFFMTSMNVWCLQEGAQVRIVVSVCNVNAYYNHA